MELKYYLRGLGLGIVVTAIIMGITSSRSKAMTDDEIIARAKQLGMIEDRVLAEAASEEDGSESDGVVNPEADGRMEEETPAPGENIMGENVSEGNTLPDADTVSGETEGMASPDKIPVMTVPDDGETGQETPTDQEEPTEPENTEDQNVPEQNAETDLGRKETSGASVVVTVGNGDGSYTVSRKLEDAGAVESASEFDTFLCENGYDKKIRAGNYTIPPDASDEQIARMITGQQSE